MANIIEKNLRTLALDGTGEVQQARLHYVVNGTAGSAEDDRDLLMQVLSASPEKVGSAVKCGAEILDCLDPEVMEIGVNYLTPAAEASDSVKRGTRRDGDRLWSIKCSAVKEKCYEIPEKQDIFYNPDTVPVSATYSPFWNGRFGEDASIGAIDKLAPRCEEFCRRFMFASNCDADFRKKAVSLVGKVNRSSFRTWSSGEVMCTGVEISEPFLNDLGELLVEMTCSFSIRRHRKDVSWFDIEVGKVKGWEHLWGIAYADPGVRTVRGVTAFVGKIYDSSDFGILGLEQ